MDTFHEQFDLLEKAWKKREYIDTNSNEVWLKNMVAVEKTIKELISSLAIIAE